jgi:hypothetical protein
MTGAFVTWVELNPAAGTTGHHPTRDEPPPGPITVLECEVTDAGDEGTEVVITYQEAKP